MMRDIFPIQCNKHEYPDEKIFYAVGLPIKVQTKGFFGFAPRKKIPDAEIINSFSEDAIGEKKLKLFKTEKEALDYSRYLREGMGFGGNQKLAEEITQPAIFKVLYSSDIPLTNPTEELLIINPSVHISDTNELSPWYDEIERKAVVNYFLAKRHEVKPLTGQLKLHNGQKDALLIHNPINYEKLENKYECRIS